MDCDGVEGGSLDRVFVGSDAHVHVVEKVRRTSVVVVRRHVVESETASALFALDLELDRSFVL